MGHPLVHAEFLHETAENYVTGVAQRDDNLGAGKDAVDQTQVQEIERELVDQHRARRPLQVISCRAPVEFPECADVVRSQLRQGAAAIGQRLQHTHDHRLLLDGLDPRFQGHIFPFQQLPLFGLF